MPEYKTWADATAPVLAKAEQTLSNDILAPVAASSGGPHGAAGRLIRLGERLGALAIGVITLVVLYDVMARATGYPTLWALEVSGYLMVAASVLAAGEVMQKGGHFEVRLLLDMLPRRRKRSIDSPGAIVTALFSVAVMIGCVQLVLQTHALGFRSPTLLQIPLIIPQGVLCAGLGLLSLATVLRALNNGKSAPDTSRWDVVVLAVVTLFLVLVALGFPVFVAMGLSGFAGSILLGEADGLLQNAALGLYQTFSQFDLIAVPLYILVGTLMERARLSEQLFSFARVWFGNFRGGLGVATIAACAMFAAISGSSVATAATIGVVALPALNRGGYRPEFSGGDDRGRRHARHPYSAVDRDDRLRHHHRTVDCSTLHVRRHPRADPARRSLRGLHQPVFRHRRRISTSSRLRNGCGRAPGPPVPSACRCSSSPRSIPAWRRPPRWRRWPWLTCWSTAWPAAPCAGRDRRRRRRRGAHHGDDFPAGRLRQGSPSSSRSPTCRRRRHALVTQSGLPHFPDHHAGDRHPADPRHVP